MSTALLARGPQMIPATTLNVLAGAWLQFETRDWFSHGTDPEHPFEVPRPDGDSWPDDPILLPRTRRDPNAAGDAPATFVNTETHWWDASQIYGSTPEFQRAIRRRELGPRAGGDRRGRPDRCSIRRCWAARAGWTAGGSGLELLHTVFMREHNAVCAMLGAAYPTWTDDQIFDKARLVIAALLAKIHTVEWTTADPRPPGAADRHARQLVRASPRNGCATSSGRLSDSEVISGIPGSPTDHHSAPYSITEEFVAVYRMHPLVPDDYRGALDSPTRSAATSWSSSTSPACAHATC